MNIHWAIQKKLTTPINYFGFIHAFDSLNIPYVTFNNDPLIKKLPCIPIDVSVMFYTAGYLTKIIYESKMWSPGVLFDIDKFKVSQYIKYYKNNFLNCYGLYQSNIVKIVHDINEFYKREK